MLDLGFVKLTGNEPVSAKELYSSYPERRENRDLKESSYSTGPSEQSSESNTDSKGTLPAGDAVKNEKSFSEKLEEKLAGQKAADKPKKRADDAEAIKTLFPEADEEGALFKEILAGVQEQYAEAGGIGDIDRKEVAKALQKILSEKNPEEFKVEEAADELTADIVTLLIQSNSSAKTGAPDLKQRNELGLNLVKKTAVHDKNNGKAPAAEHETVKSAAVTEVSVSDKKSGEAEGIGKDTDELLPKLREKESKTEQGIIKLPAAVKKESGTAAVSNNHNNEPIVIVADRRGEAAANSEFKVGAQRPPEMNLAQALRESGNTEIVQRAQVILREQDSGEIKLTLRPENLGTVRIHLSLDGNKLFGRIIVDSSSAKAAFDENMADLRDAMLKTGYAEAELDVSVGGRQSGQQQGYQEKEDVKPFYSDRLRGSSDAFEQNSIRADIGEYNKAALNVQA
jgi:flagellar protein FlbC